MLKVLQIAQAEAGNVWSPADYPQGRKKFED